MVSMTYTGFHGPHRLITAPLPDTLAYLISLLPHLNPTLPLIIVDDHTGHTTDFDLRGSVQDVLRRTLTSAASPTTNPGVVTHKVTLLPRHWDWLEAQPGGPNATLRRLVEAARKRHPERERTLQAQTAAHHFMTTFAGDFPHYQAASNALFHSQGDQFQLLTHTWPDDIRAHALHLASPAFAPNIPS